MGTTENQRILVVDDSKIIRNDTKSILESHGFCVGTAEGGEEGVAKILKEKPDLVLLDIEMPEVDGLEVFRRIRAEDGFQVLPVIIFFTAHVDKKVQGIRLGASDFIAKFLVKSDPEEFSARIHAHLKIAELVKKNIELEKINFIRAAGTSASHEILQPLTVVNVGVSSVLSRRDLTPQCDYCIECLKPVESAVEKIRKVVQDFSNVKTSETVDYAGGGSMLARSDHKK